MMKKSLEVRKEFTAKSNSFFEGGNVFITNGKDSIDEINGNGNLIVGGKSADILANPGSHNVIIGLDNKYSAYGGLAAGYGNVISGAYASVTGGESCVASGPNSSINGGVGNVASSYGSSVSGGSGNIAAGPSASVAGGIGNYASGESSSIGGGGQNQTPYLGSVVTGTSRKITESDYENLP